jgi:hypothetical protein
MVKDVFVMDKTRVLPEPHRYAICSPDDTPIKEFYKGHFEEVFVFYHPFIKPLTMDYDLFNPDTYPSRNEIRNSCEKVTWKQFLTLSGIESYKQLDIGLRTNILGLKEEYQDINSGRLIEKTCREKFIAVPNEGLFPEFIMNDLLRIIKIIGHEWLWFGDEFCTERKLEYIDDLINDNNMLNQGKNLFTHDNSILIATHWDSHFSLLCSDKYTVEQLVNSCELEGFYCNEKTEIYWSLSTD